MPALPPSLTYQPISPPHAHQHSLSAIMLPPAPQHHPHQLDAIEETAGESRSSLSLAQSLSSNTSFVSNPFVNAAATSPPPHTVSVVKLRPAACLKCRKPACTDIAHRVASPLHQRVERFPRMTTGLGPNGRGDGEPWPETRPWVQAEWKKKQAEFVKAWHYQEYWEPEGPQVMLLTPRIAATNRAMSAHSNTNSSYPTCFTNQDAKTIHYGFDNMWHAREPIYLVSDSGEAKIWWQPETERMQYHMITAPQGYRMFKDVVTPVKFWERLVAVWGVPPTHYPWEGRDWTDKDTVWAVMLQKSDGNQWLLRVHGGVPQIAYNGTVEVMYETVDLLQLLLGPPGHNLHVDLNPRVGGDTMGR